MSKIDKYETLKNMNATTAKHAVWCILILDPKIIPYQFTSRNETVHATRFECLIVSNDPKQYMLGNVPFNFDDRDAAKKAADKFKDKTVWILKTPAFDTRMKPDYNSCPLKAVVLLQSPSKFTAVPPTSTNELGHPSKYIQVGLDLKGLLNLLSSMQFAKPGPSSARPESKVLDFCGKKMTLTEPKQRDKGGKRYMVSEVECCLLYTSDAADE